jgi:hypothetical protein
MERAAPKPSPTPGLVDGSGYERPDPPTATTVETNGSDGRRKGTSLLCTRWGHFYFGATAFAASIVSSRPNFDRLGRRLGPDLGDQFLYLR